METAFEHNEIIMVPLISKEQDWATDDESGFKIVEFTDDDKFLKYLYSDAMHLICKECNAWFIDLYEEQTIYADKLPGAISILDKEIKKKKNAYIADYLIKTKEMMELALKLNTYIEFVF